ncbi:MAG: thiolase [Alphaproteobacteria bacterium]|nr:thiolase [Alphaproteobacteria bacterium]
MTWYLRGKAAIAGVATAHLGEAPGFSHMEIAATAARAALADAGLTLADVDGLFAVSMHAVFPALTYGEYLGIQPRFSEATIVGGSSAVVQMLHAAMALEHGLCDVALIVYGSNQRTASGRLHSPSGAENLPYEKPYALRSPIAGYAMSAARHMHDYGTTREQLAEVAVAARMWAAMNQEAFDRAPLTAEEVLASRMVCDPLTVRDCCLVTDGGGAIVMTRADRAKDLAKPPVHLLSCAGAHTHRQYSMMPDLTTTAAVDSGARAFAMAGLKPADVDVLQVYDAFTINAVMLLEDLGFCPKGEGGAYVGGGRLRPGGDLPFNTYGGGLSCTHPGMLGIFTTIEAVRQLRGECGARQVAGATIGLAHGNGGMFAHESTALLGTEAAL